MHAYANWMRQERNQNYNKLHMHMQGVDVLCIKTGVLHF
jgi:hypothetical protein